jgi:predicted DNA-binding WGR domain protein
MVMHEMAMTQQVPVEQCVQFQSFVRLVSRDLANNRNRFYLLTKQPAFCGDLVIMCMWGRCGTVGRSRIICSATQQNAQAIVARIIRRRMQRGYHVAAWE